MKPIILVVLVIAAALALLASPAGAAKNGAHRTVGDPGYGTPRWPRPGRRSPIRRRGPPAVCEPRDCSSSCSMLTSRRIAARRATSGGRPRASPPTRRVETKLARLRRARSARHDPQRPDRGGTLHISSAYMAATVRTAPRKLLVATFASPARGRGGVKVVWRPSPTIVRDAPTPPSRRPGSRRSPPRRGPGRRDHRLAGAPGHDPAGPGRGARPARARRRAARRLRPRPLGGDRGDAARAVRQHAGTADDGHWSCGATASGPRPRTRV